MTESDLTRLEKLSAAATPGPWYTVGPPWLPSGQWPYVIAGHDDPHVGQLVCDFDFVEYRDREYRGRPDNSDADAEFVVAARTAVPALVAEVRRLTRELEWVADERDRLLETVEREARP